MKTELIPGRLRNEPRWICWIAVENLQKGKPDKIPVNPNNGKNGSSTNQKTWASFEKALEFHQSQQAATVRVGQGEHRRTVTGLTAGVGFCLGKSTTDPELNFFGIDLDNHIVDGKLTPFAKKVIARFPTYREISPSGSGIHIIGFGKKPGRQAKALQDMNEDGSGQVTEIYDRGRYLTITGVAIGKQFDACGCQGALDKFYHEIFAEKKKTTRPTNAQPLYLGDNEIIQRAKRSRTGAKFSDLWAGNWAKYSEYAGNKQSGADLALCNYIAFYTQDAAQVDRIFRASGLYRGDKWNRYIPGWDCTYGDHTVKKSIDDLTDTWTPPRGKSDGKSDSDNEETKGTKSGQNFGDDEPIDELDDLIETTPFLVRDTPLDLSLLVPANTWLSDYLDYIQPTTDAPDQFGMACGLSIMSMACREMFVQFGQSKVRPNLWLAIIAPSSLYRKSTSITAARRLLELYEPTIVFPNQLSPEAFVKQLAEDNSFGTFIWQEISSQLEAFDNRSYMRGYKSDLTDLYDTPATWNRRTVADGLITVQNPFLNIMTASTQEWLNQCLSEGNLKGGFLPRFIWVMAYSKQRFIAFPEAPDLQKAEQLIIGMNEITNLFRGGMTVDAVAKIRYGEYLHRLEKESMASKEHEGLLGAFYSRLSGYTLKFSMLYQAMLQYAYSPESEDRIITSDAMEYAISLTEYLKAGIGNLLDQMAYNDDMRNRIKVLNIIRAEPGIATHDLYRLSKLSKKQLDDVLSTLFESRLIVMRQQESTSGKGRPKRVFFPLKSENEFSH